MDAKNGFNLLLRYAEMDLRVAGPKAIVCGASRGLGRAVADSLAAEVASLVMKGRDPDSLSSAAKAVRDKYGVPYTRLSEI